MQEPLLLNTVDLVTETELHKPLHMIYSTNPKAGIGRDRKQYVVKGHSEPDVVSAEAAAYLLAREAEIPVPSWTLIHDPNCDHLLFGSEMVPDLRDIEPWLKKGAISNEEDLPRILAFDIWISNPDRNLGNFIGRKPVAGRKGLVEVVAIDFEKATTLRGDSPLISTSTISSNELWPSNRLGELIGIPPRPSPEWIDKITTINEGQIQSAFGSVRRTLGLCPEWAESRSHLLLKRAQQLPELLEEVWV